MAAVAIEFVAGLRSRLQAIAESGTVNLDEWPETHQFLIRLFEHIVINDFPTHRSGNSRESTPSERRTGRRGQSGDGIRTPKSNSTDAVVESTTPTGEIPDANSLTDQLATPERGWKMQLPEAAVSRCEWIHECLEGFRASPPCTVQRLAEVLLEPRAHYQFLPTFLNALDRLVSVSVSELIFHVPRSSLHSVFLREEVSGAQLVPIPWLNEAEIASMAEGGDPDAGEGAGLGLRGRGGDGDEPFTGTSLKAETAKSPFPEADFSIVHSPGSISDEDEGCSSGPSEGSGSGLVGRSGEEAEVGAEVEGRGDERDTDMDRLCSSPVLGDSSPGEGSDGAGRTVLKRRAEGVVDERAHAKARVGDGERAAEEEERRGEGAEERREDEGDKAEEGGQAGRESEGGSVGNGMPSPVSDPLDIKE